MATQQRDDGKLFAVSGSSRHGKSAWVKSKVTKAPRVLCWDIRGEYVSEGFTVVKTIPELAALLKQSGVNKARVTYWGSIKDFPDWCRLAYLWGQLWPAVIVAEEISDVTGPGKAPPGWGDLIRKGLFYGNHIYSVTQRPQECDKTVWGNASVIHAHGMVLVPDQQYMADRMGVDPEEIGGLQKLEWIERWAGEREIKRGKVRF